MKLPLIGLLLWVVPLGAQLAFVQPDGAGQERALSGLYDIGAIAAGDTLEARVRLRNTGSATIRLEVLRIDGTGFSLENTPFVPYNISAGSNVDFRIRFRPLAPGSYSAPLRANGETLLVRASASAGLTLLLDGAAVTNERPVEVGPVETGKRAGRVFVVRNNTAEPIRWERTAVSGAGFSWWTNVELPAAVAPGASLPLEVRFEPVRAGVVSGTLAVDQRMISLTGIAQDPPYPEATIEFDPRVAQSGRQASLQVRLSSPAPGPASAALSIEFQPSVPAPMGDAALSFAASGSRSVTVEFSRGETTGLVNGKADITLQTGTTAGNIVFRLRLAGRDRVFPVTIPPEPPRLDIVELRYQTGSLEVIATGFDNARTAAQFTFTFTDRAGRALPPVTAEVGSQFAAYFRESALGGLFRLTARFPVTGDPLQISSVEGALKNSVGTVSRRSGVDP